jgi:transcriptional regulator with XRE-family HTH domain
MISKHSLPVHRKRSNDIHRVASVEPLSARVFRLHIARGYSVCELAQEAGIFAGTIQSLESGKTVDKRVLPVVAGALGVPLCRPLCGEHDCFKRACVPREHFQSEAAEYLAARVP